MAERWSDDRLDDLARQVRDNTDQLKTIADMRVELGGLHAEVKHVGEDTMQCITELRSFKNDLDRREGQQHDERKADRRWMVATLLTTAGLIITALAIFVG